MLDSSYRQSFRGPLPFCVVSCVAFADKGCLTTFELAVVASAVAVCGCSGWSCCVLLTLPACLCPRPTGGLSPSMACWMLWMLPKPRHQILQAQAMYPRPAQQPLQTQYPTRALGLTILNTIISTTISIKVTRQVLHRMVPRATRRRLSAPAWSKSMRTECSPTKTI